MNSLSLSEERLTALLHQLSSKWHATNDLWNDTARRDFEMEFWIEFETTTAASIAKLQELVGTLTQAEREVP